MTRLPRGLRFALSVSAGLLLAFLLSCASRSALRVEALSDVQTREDYFERIEQIRESGKKLYGNTNRLLYWYDQGLLFHYAGEYDSSLAHLEKAEQTIDELYARSVTNEAASLITNDNIRPYRGHRFEQVLLHQFLSFNYLAKREYDESLVESRKLGLVFDRFKDRDNGRERYNDDGMSHYLSSIVYDNQRERDNATISLYHAVSAYRQSSLPVPDPVKALAWYRLKRDDRPNDIQQLQLSAPERTVPGQDPTQSEIILIGYGGKAPVLQEMVAWGTYVVGGLLLVHYRNPATGDTALIRLPAPPLPESEEEKLRKGEKTRAGTTFHVKFALPAYKPRHSLTDHFTAGIDTASVQQRSWVLTDTDVLLQQDLESNFGTILARTALRVVLRTIAAQRTKDRMNTESPLVNLLVNVGTDIAADQLEKADTRTCFLLPRTIQIIRLAVEPGTHRLHATARTGKGEVIDSREWSTITVRPGEKRFVFYPSLR